MLLNTHTKSKIFVLCYCSKLPYKDDSFDLVLAINTIHNLNKTKCAKAIKEINRVSKKNAFIMVDAYKNTSGKQKCIIEFNS